MEYADGGDLSDLVKNCKTKLEHLSEGKILNFFTQMCLAIKHIHDRKIIHRDLKAQNIFLEKNGTIKLGDFGIAKVLEQTVAQANTQVGTPYYISPEIIKGKNYSFATDIWSLGVILFEMCALDVPIKAKNLHGLYMKISNFKKAPSIPMRYSKDLQNLVDCLLCGDPKKRPLINQILKKSILKERVKEYLNHTEFEEEFSHTILHNEYLFDMRKKRAKPLSKVKHQIPPVPQHSNKEDTEKPAFLMKQVALAPKPHQWNHQSPRGGKGGMVGHRPLSSRKKDSSAGMAGYKAYNARFSPHHKQKPK